MESGRELDGLSAPPSPWRGGILGFLSRHPVVFLLVLSPGIPEYLSGSSPISALVTNPGQFVFQLVLNLGLYGPGVLLIREARVRWQKGWPTVLLLGAAYAILEEGVALSTMFNPDSQVVVSSGLGTYGHWLGVSWIWVEGIILVHVLFSISTPILLLDLALPSTKEKPFLAGRRLAAAGTILCLDVSSLFGLVYFGQKFYMGNAVLAGSLLSICLLVYLARKAPSGSPLPDGRSPSFGLVKTGVVGVFAYVGILLIEGVTSRTSAILTFALVLGYEAAYLWWITSRLNFAGNERHLLAFTLGAVLPLFPFGLISQFPIDIVVIADAGLLLLYRQLFRVYPAGRGELPTQQQVENLSAAT